MRIIAGEAGGRKIKSIKTKRVRPTLDRVKEAIFNMIYYKIYKSRVLDLFAGFGGLGLEAVSRGAKYVDFVENNYRHAEVIKENIKLCGFTDRTGVIIKDVFDFFMDINTELKYDLIFMDPPYGDGLIEKVLEIIIDNNLLAEDGLIIAEHHKNDKINGPGQLLLLKNKNYGDTVIKIYREVV